MANPQKENGYTAIANEILDKICELKLNGTQMRILIVVWRFTYGFQRKEHDMSLSFLANKLNSTQRLMSKEINALSEMGLLIVSNTDKNSPRKIMFNKNYDEWVLSNQTIVQSDNRGIVQSDNRGIAQLDNQERNNINKKIKKKEKYKKEMYIGLSENVKKVFVEFEQMRKQIKKPVTERARTMLINKLSSLSSDETEQIKIIEQSILHNWQTFYQLKDNRRSEWEEMYKGYDRI